MDSPTDVASRAPEHGTPPPAWTGWRPLVGGGLLVAITATVTWTLARGSSEAAPPSSDASAREVSVFDIATGSGSGESWTAADGSWAEEAGVVFVDDAPERGGIVTTDVGELDHTVQLRIGGFGQCGVVGRYQDPTSFVALIRVHPFGVWNLIEVVDGAETILATVPDSNARDLDVSLTVTDRVVKASVGFSTVSLAHDVTARGTRVGFIARGDDSDGCSWYDVRTQQARSQ